MTDPNDDIGNYIESCRDLRVPQHATEISMKVLEAAIGRVSNMDLLNIIAYHTSMSLIKLDQRLAALEERMDRDPRGE